jgi:hypothetical protein
MTDRPSFTSDDFARDEIGGGCYAIDLDGEVHGFGPSVRDAFIERGLLQLEADGCWHLLTHGFPDLHTGAPMGYLACCDFCGARPVAWRIPCPDFDFDLDVAAGVAAVGPARPHQRLPEGRSTGDWSACATCGDLIATRRRAALLAHCQRMHDPPRDEVLPAGLRKALRQAQAHLHQQFWRHYRGGARREVPRPFGH